jgi:hypothetical protein
VLFAADYPLLDIIWTMLIFFFWVMWFWILIKVVSDLFRRRDIGGGKKTIWLIFMVFVPYIGVFAYLLTNGSHIAERDAARAAQVQEQYDDYVRSVATTGGNGGAAGEISRAKGLLDSGAIDQAEYEQIKAKALA